MKKKVVRGVMFAAIAGLGGLSACAISDDGAIESAGEEPAPPEVSAAASHLEPAFEPLYVNRSQPLAAFGGGLESQAQAYLAQHVSALGAKDDFAVRLEGRNHLGSPYLRLAQVHRGVPVWNADVVVHTSKGSIISARGNVAGGLDGIDVTPRFGADKALDLAKARYLAQVTERVAALEFSREKTELVIAPREGAAPRLVWHVVFFTELQGGVNPGLWNTFVDAHTGKVIEEWNGLHAVVQASGPGGNPKVPRYWVEQLDVEPTSGGLYIADTVRLRTCNMRNGTSTCTTVTGPLDPFSDAPIDDAHGFAEVILNMLLDWQGENSINEAGFKLVSRVHYSSSYENAFWDGVQMTYGDGASTFYPLSGSVDVIAHEIHHGFTSFHSNLTYSGQSGGMNESFSDIAGETTEAYFEQAAPDMLVGADIYKSPTGALRYMCTPRSDGRSLDHISQYTSGVDVHYSSGIMNKAFCLAARRLASGSPTGNVTMDSVKRVSRAFYVANDDFWTAGSTFQQGCQGTWDAASVLGFTTAEKCALRQSWIDVGLTCGDATLCGGAPPITGQYSYSATNTNSAQQNTINQSVTLAAGKTITLGTCGLTGAAFTGDTYLRFFGPAGTSVATNDDACGGLGSQITFTAPAAGTYQIRGGCYASGTCTGTVAWSIP